MTYGQRYDWHVVRSRPAAIRGAGELTRRGVIPTRSKLGFWVFVSQSASSSSYVEVEDAPLRSTTLIMHISFGPSVSQGPLSGWANSDACSSMRSFAVMYQHAEHAERNDWRVAKACYSFLVPVPTHIHIDIGIRTGCGTSEPGQSASEADPGPDPLTDRGRRVRDERWAMGDERMRDEICLHPKSHPPTHVSDPLYGCLLKPSSCRERERSHPQWATLIRESSRVFASTAYAEPQPFPPNVMLH
jgi:hypothetical protein